MKKWAIDILCRSTARVDEALTFRSFQQDGDDILEGVFEDGTGYWYPVTRGVPCFLTGVLRPNFVAFAERHGLPVVDAGGGRPESEEQRLTNETFSDKWTRFKQYGLDASSREFLQEWYCKKLGVETPADLKTFYENKRSVLEVGPGSGFNTRFIAESTRGEVFALDVSDAAFTTNENTRHLGNCTTVQADLMAAPFPDNYFDFVIADGVLHHTPDTRASVRALYKKVVAGGEFFFYVYKKMGAARQFCDEFIRETFTQLSPDECYKACEGLTELGRELSNLDAKVTLTKGIPELGIPAGIHDVQRLFYYNFVKCFWNDSFDYETNNMVNFDWYHPHNAWQHTESEVRGWLSQLGVTEFVINDANPNGISVLLRKP